MNDLAKRSGPKPRKHIPESPCAKCDIECAQRCHRWVNWFIKRWEAVNKIAK